MAKPIRATPTLKGNEAISFIREVLKEQKRPSKARIKTLSEALKINFNYR